MNSAVELIKGANCVLGSAGTDGLASLVIGVTWDAGALDCDLCALVCTADKRVLSDGHFLFWSQLVSPERAVFLRSREPGADQKLDRAQLLVDVSSLPNEAERITVALATVVEGANLSALKSLRLRVLEPRSGAELAAYAIGQEVTVESCLVVAEVYKHRDDWKIRAVGQGYSTGLAGLGTDYGVDIV